MGRHAGESLQPGTDAPAFCIGEECRPVLQLMDMHHSLEEKETA